MSDYHLAQLNIAQMNYTIDDPAMADFVAALDPVNAAAEAAPGFVWRLKTDEGDATGIRIYGDETLLVNMSVWESVESLKQFIADLDHGAIMRRRAEWFSRMDQPGTVLWWVPAGHVPDVAEAERKLDALRASGATAEAFDLANSYPPPGGG